MTNTESDTVTPSPAQKEIIKSDQYPMRVLAGAGTGKTFTLVRKIERLLGEKNVDPDRILALTFTNKAADSMQTKLGEKIGSKGYDIDAYTYHSICHSLLNEYAYHTGIDPDAEIASEVDKFELVLDVLDEVDYHFISPEVYGLNSDGTGAETQLANFISSMKSSGTTPQDLQEYAGDPKVLLNLQLISEKLQNEAENHLRFNWRKITSDRISQVYDGLEEFRSAVEDHIDSLGDTQIENQVTDFLELFVETAERIQVYLIENKNDIIDGELTPAFKLPGYLFGAYSSAPTGIPELGFTLTEEFDGFIQIVQQGYDLTQAYEIYERKLREQQLLDFDDLVLETITLLRNGDYTEEIASQWDYIFCDEYQDTDTVQFELVERLSKVGNLFVVGDDDQAIYEWRGANIENIGGRLTQKFPDITDKSLEENFRSKQPILDLANNALEHLEGRGSTKVLQAVDEFKDATDGVATVSGIENDEEEAEQLTRIILDITSESPQLSDRTYDFSETAILVRKKKHAKEIASQLEAAGVPYEFTDAGPDITVGVETVLAYLRAVADPTDEVSINRVLTMRYRLHDRDLRQLNSTNKSLAESLLQADKDQSFEPERVSEAQQDFSQLWNNKDIYSARRIYAELKQITNISWYLSQQDRRNLSTVDSAIKSIADGTIQPDLTTDFIRDVERYVASAGSLTSPTDQSDTSSAAVNIMTIHKSKGLDFPVVFIPNLSATEWRPTRKRQSFDALASYARGDESPLTTDLLAQDLQESRRVLHVAMTRAEEQLVLFGHDRTSDDDDGELPLEVYESILPESVPYAIGAVEFPIWDDVVESLPDAAENWTERVSALPSPRGNVMINTSEGEMRQNVVRRRIFELARKMANGKLRESDPASFGIHVDSLDIKNSERIKRTHSYTSLESAETCQRQHYLDYVVRAFDDQPRMVKQNNQEKSSGTIRERGVLFHDTAEHASKLGYTSIEQWYDLCDKLATHNNLERVTDEVKACIDRFFKTPVAEWSVIAAEREFSIEINEKEVTGFIDAICRKPDGDLVVLDYKATSSKRSLDGNYQLPIYLLACSEIIDEPVVEAGYVYVGEVGPLLETKQFDTATIDNFVPRLEELISTAENSSFDEYASERHCRYCSHRSLPCAYTP